MQGLESKECYNKYYFLLLIVFDVTVFSGDRIFFMNIVYVTFIWEALFEIVSKLCVQQKNMKTAKFLVNIEELDESFCYWLHFSSSIVIKIFEISRNSCFLLFLIILSFSKYVNIIKGTIDLTMPNMRYINQLRAQCVIWMAEGHRETAIQPKFFIKYCEMALFRHTINLWWRSWSKRGSHSQRSGNVTLKLGVE